MGKRLRRTKNGGGEVAFDRERCEGVVDNWRWWKERKKKKGKKEGLR